MKNEDSEKQFSAQNGPHILVIRLSAMGDVAMSVPVIATLVKTYPELKITVLTRAFFAPLFSHLPNVRVYEADLDGMHSGITGLGSLAKDLRDEDIDMVADLHDVLRTNVLKTVFYLYGIPFKQIDKGRAEKKELTRESDKVFKALKSTHERYAEVFKNLGYPINLENYLPPEKRELNEQILEVLGEKKEKWLGVAPFAQHDSKAYPIDLMEEVLQKLSVQTNMKVLLFGGGSIETQQLKSLENKFENAISVAGKLSFEDELSLISNLNGMLSMDSGNAHLAAIFNVPVISLWGVTHPYTGFKAFNQPLENCILPDLEKYPKIPTSVYGNKVPNGYEDVMRSISPEQVVTKILEVI